MKLNTEKIKNELKRIGKNQAWLAEQLSVSRQRVSKILKDGSIRNAERLGHLFDIPPKDLIK